MDNGGAAKLQQAKALASILSKRLQLPQVDGSAGEWRDLNDACRDLVSQADQQGLLGDCAEVREEAKQWLSYAKTFHDRELQSINDHLLKRSVLAGTGTAITLVDITVFVAVRDTVAPTVLQASQILALQENYPNLIRWFDYIQNEESVASVFKKITIKKPNFEPQNLLIDTAKKPARLVPVAATGENAASANSELNKKESNGVKKVTTNKKDKVEETTKTGVIATDKTPDDNTKTKQKKEKEEKPPQKKEVDVSVSALDIRVGLVRKVWKHPSADSLLVEEIDLGDCGVRQVVSGLAKYMKEEEMLNRRVLVIANVKAGKLRDVMSAGLVLCASNPDHSTVEPLIPPDTATVGERVTFAGHEGKPEDVLNPKKKQLEKILPDLFTDDIGVATYQGIPFMTSAGPCKSTIAKAAIK